MYGYGEEELCETIQGTLDGGLKKRGGRKFDRKQEMKKKKQKHSSL